MNQDFINLKNKQTELKAEFDQIRDNLSDKTSEIESVNSEIAEYLLARPSSLVGEYVKYFQYYIYVKGVNIIKPTPSRTGKVKPDYLILGGPFFMFSKINHISADSETVIMESMDANICQDICEDDMLNINKPEALTIISRNDFFDAYIECSKEMMQALSDSIDGKFDSDTELD